MRPKGTPQELSERRLRAVKLVLEDELTKTEAGRMVGADRNAVAQWVKLYRAGGEGGLKVRPPGYDAYLTGAQAAEVVRWITDGARAHGFDTDLWTLPRVARLIERRLSVRYHPDHLSKLLRKWGLSWQKPRTRAIERDEAAIARWVEQDWWRIKKKRSG